MTRTCSWPGTLGLVTGLLLGLVLGRSPGLAEDEILFNRDIRPILADNCFACHGPDKNKREADLRLDMEESATAERDGAAVIHRGQPDKSLLLERLTTDDTDLRMPPVSTGKSLSPRQIDLLRRWIATGAAWQQHWSLIPPVRPSVPAGPQTAWARNDIDRFIAAGWEKAGLKGSPDADRRTLLRRLTFDLLGLPPTSEEVEAFLADSSEHAYEQVVDRLLASEHFGERMAAYWLDVVRYADSAGYHSDNERSIWPYRDYVIRSFNRNKPFDQFTVEQLAGDLLPDAQAEQKIASGYNRLLQTTEEGGAQPKEYSAKYQADRVRNTSVIWMGITMGCCECHDHKYDPFSTRDFYRLAAFFADVQEKPVGRQDETPFPSEAQARQQQQLEQQLAEVRTGLDATLAELNQVTAELAPAKDAPAKEAPAKGASAPNGEKPAAAAAPPATSDARPDETQPAPAEPDPKRVELEQRKAQLEQRKGELEKQKAELEKQKASLEGTFPRSLITVSGTPRTVRVLPRGNWLDDSGEVVEPGTPAVFSSAELDRRATRLDFARWLTASDNPLVARVFVNRLWKLYFGKGLVRTPDDFGTQGEWPTHPELLDWLAVEFRESGWDVKHMVKLMVMSRTYQQSSLQRPDLREKDPANRWLACQNRYRLDAEMVRDNALAVSGLLVPTIGGPSVKPYQPAGYWQYLNFPKREWQNDTGESQHRRGLYTHWQRTFLHPSLAAFDAPTREECVVERARSNTPLQALALLNDPTYVEAARVFAERLVREGGEGDEARLAYAFRRALARAPTDTERQVLGELVKKHRQEYSANPSAAQELTRVGQKPVAEGTDLVELAAWTSVARTILNLHETITRN